MAQDAMHRELWPPWAWLTALAWLIMILPTLATAANDSSLVVTEKSINRGCLALLQRDVAQRNESVCSNLETLTNAVLSCVGFSGKALRPLRIMSPTQNLDVLPGIIKTFQNMTGWQVIVDYVVLDRLAEAALDVQATGRLVYDGWILDPIVTVDMAQQGMLEPLDGYIAADPSAEWQDVQRFFRATSSVYNGNVVGIPLAGKVAVLFYRLDVFNARGLQPPATWQELIRLAKLLNGTDFNGDGVPDYSMCYQIFDSCLEDYTLMGQIVASMTQTQGLASGWMFDPDTQASLLNGEAMLTALTILQNMLPYVNPRAKCEFVNPFFLTGQCAITIKWDEQFKGLQLLPGRTGQDPALWHGRVGFAHLPGSELVLNRTSGKLVPCSSPAVCPFGVPEVIDNKTVLVNRAPHFGLSGISGTVNAGTGPDFKRAAYQLFAYISSFNVSYPLVQEVSPAGPFRIRHLDRTPQALNLWAKVGYNKSDVNAFLAVTQGILDAGNIALDVRAEGSYRFRDVLKGAVASIIAGKQPVDVVADVNSKFSAILSSYDKDQWAQGYLAGLNLPQRPTPPPGASRDASNGQGESSKGLTTVAVIIIVVGATLAGALMVALGVKLYLRQSQPHLGWGLFGPSTIPKHGPNTTILVTDIENSTPMWELLSPEVMNQCVELHHGLVRSLIKRNYGYESATEGDSFILSFHTPAYALSFAESFQAGLLDQDWPPELLECRYAKTTWAVKFSGFESSPASPSPTGLYKAMSSGLRDLVSFGTNYPGPPSLTTVPEGPNSTAAVGASVRSTRFSPPPAWEITKPDGQARRPDTQLANSSGSTHASSGGGLLLGPETLASSQDPASSQSVLQYLQSQWQVVDKPPADALEVRLLHRGFRVRVGMHCGVTDPGDAISNATTKRVEYGGQPLSLCRAICDTGYGGMVLLSQPVLEKLPLQSLSSFGVLLNMGDYAFRETTLPPVTLFQAVRAGEEHRFGCLTPQATSILRNVTRLQSGALDAPLGHVSITFMHVVGASTLLAYDRHLADEALTAVQLQAVNLLQIVGEITSDSSSYLVEMSSGMLVAAFAYPSTAIVWALNLIFQLKNMTWNPALLSHELCEEVVVTTGVDMQQHSGTAPLPGGADSTKLDSPHGEPLPRRVSIVQVLFRGPRLKIGIDTGPVHAVINPVSGRVNYRGRIMNRAARIANKAGSSQVWCSEGAWNLAWQIGGGHLQNNRVSGQPIGGVTLKGVTGQVRLVHCCMASGTTSRSKSSRTAGVVPMPIDGLVLSEPSPTSGTPHVVVDGDDSPRRSSRSSISPDMLQSMQNLMARSDMQGSKTASVLGRNSYRTSNDSNVLWALPLPPNHSGNGSSQLVNTLPENISLHKTMRVHVDGRLEAEVEPGKDGGQQQQQQEHGAPATAQEGMQIVETLTQSPPVFGLTDAAQVVSNLVEHQRGSDVQSRLAGMARQPSRSSGGTSGSQSGVRNPRRMGTLRLAQDEYVPGL